MAPLGRDQSGADLPAPYRSPWLALGGDLLAVAADLRLRGRELWRRNRNGELPYPKFWPASLAAGFWPLVVVAAMGLLGLGLWFVGRPGASPEPVPPGVISSGTSAGAAPGLELSGADPQGLAPIEARRQGKDSSAVQGQSTGQITDQSTTERQGEASSRSPVAGSPRGTREATGAAGQAPGPGRRSGAAADGSSPASGPQTREPFQANGPLPEDQPPISPHPLDTNPLEEWLQRPEAAGLLLKIQGDPGLSRLQLVLSDAFGQLTASEQQLRADLWLAWAQDWGYDTLELRGPGGALLGREARVGGGMILGFSP